MPYIDAESRAELDGNGPPASQRAARNAGELNYLVSREIDKWVAEHGLSYDTIRYLHGQVELMKAEITFAASGVEGPNSALLAQTPFALRVYGHLVGFVADVGGDWDAVAGDALAAFDGAWLEFYIRVARPYEDVKVEVNGEVFDMSLIALREAQSKVYGPRTHAAWNAGGFPPGPRD